MEQQVVDFDISEIVHKIQHFLPAQAAIKDFVHHNPLHAFQSHNFHKASQEASALFGATTYLSLSEYREFVRRGEIAHDVLDRVLHEKYPDTNQRSEIRAALNEIQDEFPIITEQNGVRNALEKHLGVNLNKYIFPRLFRILSSFLDQGIQTVDVFKYDLGFLEAIRDIERQSFTSFFDTTTARNIFMNEKSTISDLLRYFFDDPAFYEPYLFEQQLNHPGWSGFVSVVEHSPQTMISRRIIKLEELIFLELALELDAVYKKRGAHWSPMSSGLFDPKQAHLPKLNQSQLFSCLAVFQEAYEWTYFDVVLDKIRKESGVISNKAVDFQAMFCIDDRSVSLRKSLQLKHPTCQTFGTPGYFGVEFYYQPFGAEQYTKSCPAPVNPKYLIREKARVKNHKNDPHFSHQSYGFVMGLIYSMTLGFWSIMKLVLGTFKPTDHAFGNKAEHHMHPDSELEIDFKGEVLDELHLGFASEEMALRVKNVLQSIGLAEHFAEIVYVVGHGASSVNNPYYAGYDCGACSGRPGSVNARVFAQMANKPEVRKILAQAGIDIPANTLFIPALHDTTRDEIFFFDDSSLGAFAQKHSYFKTLFKEALVDNAALRAGRFELIDSDLSRHKKHQLLKDKSNSLFEPRPEWNHTDNALCIVGMEDIYTRLDLDKRAFLNSYNYRLDEAGTALEMILSAAIPVCGGINLEYYFSRMDQQKFGAGTKLPHNVIGLFALTNGVEDDLRPGLPSQMIEIHTPFRILFLVEQEPRIVLKVLMNNPKLLEWVQNQWVWMVALDPKTNELYRYENMSFIKYEPKLKTV
jgi:uncharacterized protein YbcC (UPF0753/DUF2309 family)